MSNNSHLKFRTQMVLVSAICQHLKLWNCLSNLIHLVSCQFAVQLQPCKQYPVSRNPEISEGQVRREHTGKGYSPSAQQSWKNSWEHSVGDSKDENPRSHCRSKVNASIVDCDELHSHKFEKAIHKKGAVLFWPLEKFRKGGNVVHPVFPCSSSLVAVTPSPPFPRFQRYHGNTLEMTSSIVTSAGIVTFLRHFPTHREATLLSKADISRRCC